jgi:hypothetical protein
MFINEIPNEVTNQKYTTQPLKEELISLLVVAGVISAAVLLWNKLFLGYVATNSFKGDVFRPAFLRALPPIYGISTAIDWLYFVEIAVVIFAALFFFSMLEQKRYIRLFIVTFFLLFTFLFSTTENRFSAPLAHFATYLESVSAFGSPLEVVQRYTEKQATLNVHSAHYPPGNLWLVKVFEQYASVTLLKYCLYLLMALSLLILVSQLEQVYLIAFIAIPALLIYPSIDVVALPFFCFTIGLFVLQNVHSPLWKPILLGAVSSLWLFFSFSVFVFWLFLLVLECVEFFYTRTIQSRLWYHFLHITTVGFFLVALYLFFHYSIVDNFTIALSHNVQINSNYFDHPIRFLFRSTGNVLEFSLGVGLPFLLLFRKSDLPPSHSLHLKHAFLFTLFIASCSGLFFMETDRVWFFLIPIVILISNEELKNSTIHFRRIFSFFAVLYVLWFELSAIHFC